MRSGSCDGRDVRGGGAQVTGAGAGGLLGALCVPGHLLRRWARPRCRLRCFPTHNAVLRPLAPARAPDMALCPLNESADCVRGLSSLTGCGPCRMISPVIDELAAEYSGKIKAVRACSVPVSRDAGATLQATDSHFQLWTPRSSRTVTHSARALPAHMRHLDAPTQPHWGPELVAPFLCSHLLRHTDTWN